MKIILEDAYDRHWFKENLEIIPDDSHCIDKPFENVTEYDEKFWSFQRKEFNKKYKTEV